MSASDDRIREELARLGIAVSADDLAMIVKIVEGNRAGLACVPADAVDDPEVSHGFLPPPPPDGERTAR